MTYYNDELYHYGVLGMKWGVRKKGYDKYVRKAEKHEAKAAAALAKGKKHAYFKNSDKAKDYRYMAKTSKRMQEAKGFFARRNAKYGFSSKADLLENKASKMADRGENRRFRFTRAKAKKRESIIRRSAKILDAYANTPIRTMGGRMLTEDQRSREKQVTSLLTNLGGVPAGVGSALYYEYKGYFKNNK